MQRIWVLLWLACVEACASTLALKVLDETGKPAAARVCFLNAARVPQPVAAAAGPALIAAHLHFAPTLTGWNDAANDSAAEGGNTSNRIFTVDNCEDERHWGAALFLGVKPRMRLHPRDAEYPPPSSTWGEARSRGGFIDLE